MIGKILNNRYTIEERLGNGAMGTVYRALDSQNGQNVALKVISSELALHPGMVERFRREGESLRSLRHFNIVGFVDFFEHEGHYVIVMEYVSGGTLLDLLKKGPLPVERARQIALELSDALIRAHRLNIIHRDIKPENVLLTGDGAPKLADFGVARLSEGTRITRTGTQVGTPYYMAPEAWAGKSDAQSDIWSLGVVLFEMLSGEVPFDGDTPLVVMNRINTMPPDLKKLPENIPADLRKIISRMLTRDRKKRYQRMHEVVADLERIGGPSTERPKKEFKKIPKWLGWAGMGLAFAAVIWLGVKNIQSLNFPALLGASSANDAKTSPKDGMTMVFVPAGRFIIGNNAGDADERPEHLVDLDAFWIDKTEITNAMYALCVAEADCRRPLSLISSKHAVYFDNPDFGNYPVIQVDWSMAKAYCEWAGRRLPTEAEWEKAARGTDGRLYPWGDQEPNETLLNFNGIVGDTVEVGSYPDAASTYGALDMAGNVWEWTNSLYKPYPYNPADGRERLSSQENRVIRGGAWSNFLSNVVNSATRIGSPPDFTHNSLGFRCAQDDPQ